MNTNGPSAKPRILVAPLDWGLGHATRCIPIIQQLLKEDCSVVLAGEGKIAALLKTEFPQLEILPLSGYQISYGKNKWELAGKLLLQIPKILEAMDEEHDWLDKLVEEKQIDAVISDNRYGLQSEKIPCVFITHQLLIKTNLGKTSDRLLQKLNYEYINAFSECWVPDFETENSLAGELAHPEKQPNIPLHYVGSLSRFKKSMAATAEQHLLVLLSGPEPQRSILEKKLLADLEQFQNPVLLVRGLPGNEEKIEVPAHIRIEHHLPVSYLQQAIEAASVVISRCGYSTVMDLFALQKKSILIPTPGQTEQEYLSSHLMKKNFALCIPQDKFRLRSALDLASSFPYHFSFTENNALEKTVKDFVDRLKADKLKGKN